MSATLYTPIALSEPVKAGRRRFWKQILPETEITYNGKKIAFDRKFHLDLANAFKAGAYDQVPLVFADAANSHNMDPRNFGGEVIRTEYRGPGKDQGTWALIEADREGARAIKKNPKLGVSARIVQGLEKADGRVFNRALNHVLLTMNPRVTGMSPWQAVDLSEDADTEVVDLTAQHYTEGKSTMGTKPKSRASRREIDLSALSDEEFANLLDLAATATAEREDEDEDLDEDLEDEVVEVVRPRRKRSKVKTTKVVERESEDDDPDAEDDEDEDDRSRDTDLSELDTFRSEFQAERASRAARDWKSKRGVYLASGVPPVLLDLAEPVLSQPDHMTLDLSDGEKAFDVHDFAEQMLDNVKHIIDLGGEIGSAYDLSVDDDTQSEADAFLDAWDTQYG